MKEVVDYEILKYPKSEDKEINLAFKKAIVEVDNLANIENDLLYRTNTKFKI